MDGLPWRFRPKGSLDDPQFNPGKVFYSAIETVLTRIATSPFSVLAALFGGKGEEWTFQEFHPGSTNLLPAAISNLDVLAKGLYERPELQLEIEGSADPVTDLAALRRAQLSKQLVMRKWNAAANLFAAETNAAATAIPPTRSSGKAFFFEKGFSALKSTKAYWSSVPTQSALTENSPGRSPLRPYADDKGATALMLIFAPAPDATDPDRERELLETVEIAPDALQVLAVERARNVKAYLVQTGKVEAQRITESAGSGSPKGSRVYVQLQ